MTGLDESPGVEEVLDRDLGGVHADLYDAVSRIGVSVGVGEALGRDLHRAAR